MAVWIRMDLQADGIVKAEAWTSESFSVPPVHLTPSVIAQGATASQALRSMASKMVPFTRKKEQA
jgi:hypothetical protein